ncbi:hypothetical protein BCR33DRAFT_370281 [Rhizoclosmatium globosum]|uniref:G-protein coupled receptors family 1 profile domain-containing protein n=1 Tax=Rhizoclosmatium globosum TaxID=329046 RepID=A0A1Y2BZD8_9FUNG|nr:hypothetical protein BCR33DRAFT_370281 [Rhizoclosmatium globosum]|eukprot:ORY40130.1 hypothetical protein BCR33DRAFT_370281 [Rhizoclosmatium globosum]
MFGCGNTLLFCLGLTLFRYFSVVARKQISRVFAIRFIFGCIFTSVLMVVFPFIIKNDWAATSLILQPSGTYCLLYWGTEDTETRWLVFVLLVWIATPITIIGWAYYWIYATFQSSANALRGNYEESGGKSGSGSSSATTGTTGTKGPMLDSKAAETGKKRDKERIKMMIRRSSYTRVCVLREFFLSDGLLTLFSSSMKSVHIVSCLLYLTSSVSTA